MANLADVKFSTIIAILLLPILVLLIFLVFHGAEYFVPTRGLDTAERVRATNSVRATLLRAVAGSVVLYGLYFTGRTLALNRAGHLSDRFTKAIDQIGNENPDVRIGGLYALEMISLEHKVYRTQALEVLMSFVRSRCPEIPENGQLEGAADRVPSDAQVALSIIGRRKGAAFEPECLDFWARHMPGARLADSDLERANFYHANLDGADLTVANLTRAGFGWASLRRASLTKANMSRASFYHADLESSFMGGADLKGADFRHANLKRVDFTAANCRTNLEGANLTDANLENACFEGLDLSGVMGLTWDQARKAQIDKHTKLPPDLGQRPTAANE